ncbi:MAG: CopD family protein [bacterium]|nr:CopD family protein [bacterium]
MLKTIIIACRKRRLVRWLWVCTALLFAAAFALPAAQAHGYIVRAIPEDQAVLERAPVRVQYWFSEGLEPAYSSITIRDAERNLIAEGGVNPDDPALLNVRLPAGLPDGAYLSELKIAFASDGHVIYETRTFFVGAAASASAGEGFGGTARSDLPVPLEIVWRAVVLSAQVLLFGLFAGYAWVFVPAWGNPRYPAGLLPPRLMNRLFTLAGIALAAAFAGNLLALMQQTMVFFNADLPRVIGDGLWNIVRTGTRFGDTWNARMGFLLLVAALLVAGLALRKDYPWVVQSFWAGNGWLMALVMGTMTLASHAPGSLTLAWVAVFSDWVHGMATGIWAGGAAALALVLPAALHGLADDGRRAAMLAAMRRFTHVAAAGMIVVVASGFYNALNWFNEPDDLPTTYGGALAVKLLLVALLIGVGAAHHIALRPHLLERPALRWIRRLRDFVPSLRLEAALVLAVLIAVGALSATPVPPLSLSGQTLPAPTETQLLDDLTVTTTISPGGPGVNTFDVLITREGAPVDDVQAALRISDPARDVRGALHLLEPLGDGLYTVVTADIDQPGAWWTTILLENPAVPRGGAEPSQIAAAWTIAADAAVLQSRDPGLLNIAALIGLMGALAFAALPLMRRFYQALDLSPAAVTVAAGASAATVFLVILTTVIIDQTNAQYARTINPPPQVVNAVLPTAESVERGAGLAAACGWNDPAAARDLTERLARTRDQDLYRLTHDGWRNLPPCGALDDGQRWDVVNYLRTLEALAIFAREPAA